MTRHARNLLIVAVAVMLLSLVGCEEEEPSVTIVAWPADHPCFEGLDPGEEVYLEVSHCTGLGLEPPVRIVPRVENVPWPDTPRVSGGLSR